MSSSKLTTVHVKIVNLKYPIKCRPEAASAVEAAARHLDRQMREIREARNVIGHENLAVAAALNIVDDHLAHVSQQRERVRRLEAKLDAVLGEQP